MRVAIIQSCYLPWRGYFDFIRSVDKFIIYDDCQYTSRDWRSRNTIKSSNGVQWMTVPIIKQERSVEIRSSRIDYSQKWQAKHKNQMFHAYKKSQYFDNYYDYICNVIDVDYETISELNIGLTRYIMGLLSIDTELAMSWDFSPEGTKTSRLISILRNSGATEYLSGPSARDYLQENLFPENNIQLEYKTYDYDEYPQLWGNYVGLLSIVDLLFNVGSESSTYINSNTKNIKVLL